jgi:hypothetical protein
MLFSVGSPPPATAQSPIETVVLADSTSFEQEGLKNVDFMKLFPISVAIDEKLPKIDSHLSRTVKVWEDVYTGVEQLLFV